MALLHGNNPDCRLELSNDRRYLPRYRHLPAIAYPNPFLPEELSRDVLRASWLGRIG
jgi:hypothetical protein